MTEEEEFCPLPPPRTSGPCVPMSCPVCSTCCAVLDSNGQPTGLCTFGGPFSGYEEVP